VRKAIVSFSMVFAERFWSRALQLISVLILQYDCEHADYNYSFLPALPVNLINLPPTSYTHAFHGQNVLLLFMKSCNMKALLDYK